MTKIVIHPESHWTKVIFQKHKVPLGAIAKTIQKNYYYTSKILNGNVAATPEVEAILANIVGQLQEGKL